MTVLHYGQIHTPLFSRFSHIFRSFVVFFKLRAFAEAVSARLQTVLKEGQKARPVYASERERYTAIIDVLIAGSSLCDADMAFKVRYEQTLREDDALLFENKIRFAFAQKKEY